MKKKGYGKIIIIVTLLLTAGISFGFLTSQETKDFRIAKNLDIFFSVIRELNTFYVDDIDPDKMIKSAIDNMLNDLDPYTVYYPESEKDEVSFMTTGKYGGIGSLVRKSGNYITISEVYSGFPADKAGIKAGDVIKKINGESIYGLSTSKVSERLKGDAGTELIITIERNGEESDFSVKREKVMIPPVPYYGMLDSKTGYIRFSSFTQGCIINVKNALTSLKENNPEQIILDLRGNPGGLMVEAINVVNLFVGAGNMVVSTKGKVKQFDASYKTTKAAVDENIPLAILINRGSASASEIVAGAIQDLDRGIIVGQRSYGKGLVQITRPLNYNTNLKVTSAKYYIPSGRCIQALDFSHPNEDGSVGAIPDSLISEYKTKNGRTVKDGGGITPDIVFSPEPLSQIATELYLRNYIFDFATKYYWSHPEIVSPEQFVLTDSDYSDFKEFLEERNFSYKTLTEESLNGLIANAKKEKYYELHKELFTELQNDIAHSLDHDLSIFREEITSLMEDEIISRYFYKAGAIERSIKKDEQVLKALEILNNREKYDSVLNVQANMTITTENIGIN